MMMRTADVVYSNCVRTSARILSMSSAAMDSATSCHVGRASSSPWSAAFAERVPIPSAGPPWSPGSGGGSMGIKIPRFSQDIGGGAGNVVSRPFGASDGAMPR